MSAVVTTVTCDATASGSESAAVQFTRGASPISPERTITLCDHHANEHGPELERKGYVRQTLGQAVEAVSEAPALSNEELADMTGIRTYSAESNPQPDGDGHF